MISKKLASALLLEATAFGADFAEVYRLFLGGGLPPPPGQVWKLS